MWVTYDNPWVFYAGSIVLVSCLYGAKSLVLRMQRNRRDAATIFALAVCVCVPITWALSPDWGNRHVSPIANFIGIPIATLAVPVVSFFVDLAGPENTSPEKRLIRYLLEWFVAVPLWFLTWVIIEVFILGWVFI